MNFSSPLKYFSVFSYLSSSLFFFCASIFIFSNTAFAAPSGEIQIFTNTTCEYCKDEKLFLESQNIPYKEIIAKDELDLYTQIAEKFELGGTPLTLAGNTFFQGYTSDELTGAKILKAYEESEKQYTFQEALTADISEFKIDGDVSATCDAEEECAIPEAQKVSIPFFGEFEVQSQNTALRYGSSFILGFLDGFNPCAMWVLIIFIITLIQVGDRMKMIFVAGTFMLAEAILYGLILILWYAFFNTLAVGYADTINIVVGIVAICAGAYFLYEGIYTDGTCNVTNNDQKKSISQKISDIANSPISWAAFGGILLLAFSVNLIEFACSAGYPQIFTNILSSISGDIWHKAGLLLTYLFAYMLDDLIIFGIALISIEKLGVTQKYAKACNIFGGIVMMLLGLTMAYDVGILKAIF